MPGSTIVSTVMSRRLAMVLFVLGAAALIAAALTAYDEEAGLAFWPLAAAVNAERLLPLIGLGVLFAQLRMRARLGAMLLFCLGALLGIVQRNAYYDLMAPVPGAAAHFFLTGPIACVLVGVMLVFPPRLRAWIVLPLIVPVGAVIATGILLSDPTLHSLSFEPVAMLAAAWFVLGIGLAANLTGGVWLGIGSRVLGSWLVAIGLLFGGAHIAAKRVDLTPPEFVVAPEKSEYPGFAGWIEGAGRGAP